MQWASLAFENLSLLTHSLQRVLEHSVHSKQYKQTTINNNPTNNKPNTTSNMDNNKNNKVDGPSSSPNSIYKKNYYDEVGRSPRFTIWVLVKLQTRSKFAKQVTKRTLNQFQHFHDEMVQLRWVWALLDRELNFKTFSQKKTITTITKAF